jgi:hypothetical protein
MVFISTSDSKDRKKKKQVNNVVADLRHPKSEILRVLSWDVGIRNAAFCFLEKKVEKDSRGKISSRLQIHGNFSQDLLRPKKGEKKSKILNTSWGLVDLLDQHEQKCIECGRVAMWVTSTEKHRKGYCGQHVGGKGLIAFSGSKSCHLCPNKGKMVVKGRSKEIYCQKHFHAINSTLPKLKLYTKLSSSTFAIEILKATLIGELEKRKKEFLKADFVVIENQPSLTNPKMKAISETLYHWFLFRGIVDRALIQKTPLNAFSIKGNRNGMIILDVHQIGLNNETSYTLTNTKPINSNLDSEPRKNRPSKLVKEDNVEIEKQHLDASKYSQIQFVEFMSPNAKIPDRKISRQERKAKIMKICEESIKGTPWESFYKNHPKRDDLADCYVQAKVIFDRMKDKYDWVQNSKKPGAWFGYPQKMSQKERTVLTPTSEGEEDSDVSDYDTDDEVTPSNDSKMKNNKKPIKISLLKGKSMDKSVPKNRACVKIRHKQ